MKRVLKPEAKQIIQNNPEIFNIIDKHWDKIKEKIDTKLKTDNNKFSNNPLIIDRVCAEIFLNIINAVDGFPHDILSIEDTNNLLTCIFYSKDVDVDNARAIMYLSIRDKYFEENNIPLRKE